MIGTSMLDEWYALYQSENPEKFNEEFLRQRSKNENLKDILTALAKPLEITGLIDFLGVDIEEDESKFTDLHSISESRLIKCTVHLKIHCQEPEGYQEEETSFSIFLPKIIDEFFFVLNGSRYYAILQCIDKGTFSMEDSIGLKTMLMPFIIRRTDYEIVDTEDNKYSGNVMELDVFKNNVNILLYFVSECGLSETLNFFAASDYFAICEQNEVIDNPELYVRFKFGKKFDLVVTKEFFERDRWITFTLLQLLIKSKVSSEEDIQNPEFWNYQLGKLYTTNKDQCIKKAEKIHSSIRRILDDNTKRNMVHVQDKDKKSIYHLFRWMLVFFNQLQSEDSMDLKNKRLRLNEYILYPLIKKLSTETYRCLNTRKPTMRLLRSMFSNIKQNLCIKQLITSELLRYVTNVNCIDLFSAGLKISHSGPQGLNSSSSVPIRYRGQHPSYIGNIGLNAASAGDPGMTATLTPFVKIDDLFFDKTMSYRTGDEYPEDIELL